MVPKPAMKDLSRRRSLSVRLRPRLRARVFAWSGVVLLAGSLGLASGCKRTEAGSCGYWTSKLSSETDELAAVKGLVDQKCAGASEALAGRLGESRVPGEVIAAIGALPATDAAREALRKALSDGRVAEAAAKVLVEWKDAGALDALRGALVAPGAERRRGVLLDAALALTDGATAPLLEELAALVAADPALQTMDTSRRAAHLLADGVAKRPDSEQSGRLSGLVASAALRPELRSDVEIAGTLRLALARLGLADPAPLLGALDAEDPSSPLLAELLWDGGAGGAELASHLAATLKRDDVASPRRLTDVATAALALSDPGAAEPIVPLLVDAPHRRMDVAAVLGAIGLAAPLWERFAQETGASRAALVPALALAIGAGDLDRWKTDVEGSPSALVRELGGEVTARERVALLRTCPDGACVVGELQGLTAKLEGLGAALATARSAHDTRRKAADEELAKLTAAFKEAEAKGEITEADRRPEMDRLRKKRDELFEPLGPLAEELATHVAVRERVLRGLLTLVRASEAPEGAWEAAKGVWEAAQGDELADVRLWAAVALERLTGPDKAAALRSAADANLAEPTAVHLIAVSTRLQP